MLQETINPNVLDLTACDREQVQFCGAIQPHGLLIALNAETMLIEAASANTAERLGTAPRDLFGLPLASALPAVQAAWMLERVRELKPGRIPVHLLTAILGDREYEAFAHQFENRIFLELEEVPPQKAHPGALHAQVRTCVMEMQAARGVENFLEVAVRHVRAMTGYDRVLAFEFLGDGTGHILAEARRGDLKSFVGLHFPPSDIPIPARRIMSLVWVRHQPDIAYTESPIEAAQSGAPPLDLSYSLLRSTSQLCNRFYLNMGIRSKLSISLLDGGNLWGMITCHHDAPMDVPYETRLACESVAHAVSMSIADKETAQHAREAAAIRMKVDELAQKIAETDFAPGPLVEEIWQAIPSGGAATLLAGEILLRGATPAEAEVRELAAWIEMRQPAEFQTVFSTHCLPARFAPAMQYRSLASGVLAARLGAGEYLLWFRPETDYEVTWAGDPQKPVEVDRDTGQLRLAPRTAFEMRQGPLTGLSEPWKAYEAEAAQTLRRSVVLARRAEALAATNLQLESLAHTAAHDLRTPLRGIRMSSEWLSEEVGEMLSGADRAQIFTIQRLAKRMDSLLSSLTDYSEDGAPKPKRPPTDRPERP